MVGVGLVGDDGGGSAERVHLGGRAHAELLAPAIEEVCAASGCTVGQVDRIAVDIGPGLFTGLRVGVATAKALGQALGIGVIGVTSLDILAAGGRRRCRRAGAGGRRRWPRWWTPGGARSSPPPTGSTRPGDRAGPHRSTPGRSGTDRLEPIDRPTPWRPGCWHWPPRPDRSPWWATVRSGTGGSCRPRAVLDLGRADRLSAPPRPGPGRPGPTAPGRRGRPRRRPATWCPTTDARPTPGSTGSSGRPCPAERRPRAGGPATVAPGGPRRRPGGRRPR